MVINKKQRLALWCGIGLVLLTGIFPPWKYLSINDGPNLTERPAGYSFIFLGAPTYDARIMKEQFIPSEKEDRLKAEKAMEEARLKTEQAKAKVSQKEVERLLRQMGKDVPSPTPDQFDTNNPDTNRLITSSQDALQDAEFEEKAIYEKYKYVLEPYSASFNFSVQIDMARFVIQLVTIILTTIGLVFVLQDRDK